MGKCVEREPVRLGKLVRVGVGYLIRIRAEKNIRSGLLAVGGFLRCSAAVDLCGFVAGK